MISEKRRDQALTYLATTDEPCAAAKSLLMGLDKQEKTVLGVQLLDLAGDKGTVGEKDARCRDSEAHRQWLSDYQDAALDYWTMHNKRSTEALILECWRTEQANRRAGGQL